MKLPRGSILVVASHNPGKVREIKALLGPHGIEPLSAAELGLAEPEETGATFAANAELKARAAAEASRPCRSGRRFRPWRRRAGRRARYLFGALGGTETRISAVADGAGGARTARQGRTRMTSAGEIRLRAGTGAAVHRTTRRGPHFEGEVHGHLVFPPRGDAAASAMIRSSFADGMQPDLRRDRSASSNMRSATAPRRLPNCCTPASSMNRSDH